MTAEALSGSSTALCVSPDRCKTGRAGCNDGTRDDAPNTAGSVNEVVQAMPGGVEPWIYFSGNSYKQLRTDFVLGAAQRRWTTVAFVGAHWRPVRDDDTDPVAVNDRRPKIRWMALSSRP